MPAPKTRLNRIGWKLEQLCESKDEKEKDECRREIEKEIDLISIDLKNNWFPCPVNKESK